MGSIKRKSSRHGKSKGNGCDKSKEKSKAEALAGAVRRSPKSRDARGRLIEAKSINRTKANSSQDVKPNPSCCTLGELPGMQVNGLLG